MSLLVPDYDSSSDEETTSSSISTSVNAGSSSAPSPHASIASSAPKRAPVVVVSDANKTTKAPTSTLPRAKKPRTTLWLPPEIQRLLESGKMGADSSSDDDEEDDDLNSLLAKRKRALAAAKAKRTAERAQQQTNDAQTSLSFLPAPKHQLPTPKRKDPVIQPPPDHSEATEDQGPAPVNPHANYYQEQAWQYDAAPIPVDEQERSSKRQRTRDRDLERALQQGQFDQIDMEHKIINVQGPAPNAWETSAEHLKDSNNPDAQAAANFWSTDAGLRMATMRPSRLQRQRHQLNQLAFDAKLREFELLEKKGQALKTKKETHAKYGW